MNENIDKFIDALQQSLSQETFVKLTLGNYKGTDEHLQKIQVRIIKTKKGKRLYFLYRSDIRDTVKNYDFNEGIDRVRKYLGFDFFGAHLFTTLNDLQLDIGTKGRSRLNIGRPTFRSSPSPVHDRQKKRLIDRSAFYLKALGITNDESKVRDRAQDKWRQINRFVEIVSSLVEGSELAATKRLRIVDMGCGKGYLTFALYDYFRNMHKFDVDILGVELRTELVDRGNEIARMSEFEGLGFLTGGIADVDLHETDILIALHACDTASDEALFKGIKADASIIVAAPCCHRELRTQIKPPDMLKDVLKHGIMLERTAEFITDSLRSLLLERSGYSTKLLDFVPIEHTPKNLMLVGTRDRPVGRAAEIDRQIAAIKACFSIREQRLETLLTASRSAQA